LHVCRFAVHKMEAGSLAMQTMKALPGTMFVHSRSVLIECADAMHHE